MMESKFWRIKGSNIQQFIIFTHHHDDVYYIISFRILSYTRYHHQRQTLSHLIISRVDSSDLACYLKRKSVPVMPFPVSCSPGNH